MPSMLEIYQRHAFEYDELINHEDFNNNLGSWLQNNIDWDDKIVCEAGAGTGRVTSLYKKNVKRAYLFDRSSHMLSTLTEKFKSNNENIIVKQDEHLNISLEEKADIFIEGWSFGHFIIENNEDVAETIQRLNEMILHNITEHGTSIIIETLGTNVSIPTPPRDVLAIFYHALEEQYGYTKNILRTDYRFKSPEEASRIMGFFFGEEMGREIQQAGRAEIREFTGVWVR